MKRLQLRDFHWVLVLIGLWSSVVTWTLITHGAPASLWFEVQRVEIFDGAALEAPRMEVERTIHREFDARWTVTVMRETAPETGLYFTYCTAHGANDYRPENALPLAPDLNWWTWPTQCRLPPGRYYVSTVWRIVPQWFPEKVLRVRSNVFEMW